MNNFVVLLSGGIDSSTLVAHIAKRDCEVYAISFDYGSRHNKRELVSAREIAGMYCVDHHVVDLCGVLSGGALMGCGDVPREHYSDETQKQTVVPNRNMVMLAIAASHAINIGAENIAYACHAGDADVYPDCRPEFVEAMDAVLGVCDYSSLALFTPFLRWTKRGIAQYAIALGVPVEKTYSCYEGGQEHCGKCGACQSRQEALK